jgi:hypothetical protein
MLLLSPVAGEPFGAFGAFGNWSFRRRKVKSWSRRRRWFRQTYSIVHVIFSNNIYRILLYTIFLYIERVDIIWAQCF